MSTEALTSQVTLDQYTAMSMPERRRVWIDISDITEAKFDAYMEAQKAREAFVPRIGSEAPDLAADVLGENRQRTGQQVRLSDLRGSPVGLSFVSLT